MADFTSSSSHSKLQSMPNLSTSSAHHTHNAIAQRDAGNSADWAGRDAHHYIASLVRYWPARESIISVHLLLMDRTCEAMQAFPHLPHKGVPQNICGLRRPPYSSGWFATSRARHLNQWTTTINQWWKPNPESGLIFAPNVRTRNGCEYVNCQVYQRLLSLI